MLIRAKIMAKPIFNTTSKKFSSLSTKRHFLLRYKFDVEQNAKIAEQREKLDEQFSKRVEEFEDKRILLFGGKISDAEEETFVYLFESENEVAVYDFIKKSEYQKFGLIAQFEIKELEVMRPTESKDLVLVQSYLASM